jgi:glycosyltransferase involved in cell wall biosynthesis
MAQKPLVTAVITTYERPELVKRAIKSVVNQTYNPLQIIVVEDGSESGVDKWIDEQGLDEIIYICHDENKNGAAARNTGIKAANGKYIGFLDDDDEWKPQFIERLTKKAENLPEEQWRSLGVVYAALEVKRPDGSTQINYPKNEGNLKESIIEIGARTLDSSLFFSKTCS